MSTRFLPAGLSMRMRPRPKKTRIHFVSNGYRILLRPRRFSEWTGRGRRTRSLVNVARFSYNRFNETIAPVDANVNPTQYGLNTGITDPRLFGFPRINPSTYYFDYLGGNSSWPLQPHRATPRTTPTRFPIRSGSTRCALAVTSAMGAWTTTGRDMGEAALTSITWMIFLPAMSGPGVFCLAILRVT